MSGSSGFPAAVKSIISMYFGLLNGVWTVFLWLGDWRGNAISWKEIFMQKKELRN
jgi:hypothetical protein